jgi:hypothetical protein
MSAFDRALAEYKAALSAAEVDAVTVTQRGLYELHVTTVGQIEERYRETGSAYACRLLIEGEGIVHKSDILKGAASERMRLTFAKLVDAVREAYGT